MEDDELTWCLDVDWVVEGLDEGFEVGDLPGALLAVLDGLNEGDELGFLLGLADGSIEIEGETQRDLRFARTP